MHCQMFILPTRTLLLKRHAKNLKSAWGVPLSDKIGLTVTEMIPGIEDDMIRALYIVGEDPVMSDPNSKHIRKCLEQCELVILQEIFPSETSPYADILLPGVSFAEKTGTFTNTERRVQLVRKAIEPLGEARPDWQIVADLAKRVFSFGARKAEPAPFAGWDYVNTSQIMNEIGELTPSYAGVSFERLERGDQLHWPVKDEHDPGTPILHTSQFTRGRGKFTPIEHVPPAESPDDDYPMLLNTGSGTLSLAWW